MFSTKDHETIDSAESLGCHVLAGIYQFGRSMDLIHSVIGSCLFQFLWPIGLPTPGCNSEDLVARTSQLREVVMLSDFMMVSLLALLLWLGNHISNMVAQMITMHSDVKEAKDEFLNLSWDVQDKLKFISEKQRRSEQRLDKAGGQSWDIIRHLIQHFENFSSDSGGGALYKEFLVGERLSLASGPCSVFTKEILRCY